MLNELVNQILRFMLMMVIGKLVKEEMVLRPRKM